MKAKDYAEQYFKNVQIMVPDDAASKVFIAFASEIIEIAQARHVSIDAGMISIIKEQNQKWQAFCRIVNKDHPRLKEDGFLKVLIKDMPWLGPLLEKGANP